MAGYGIGEKGCYYIGSIQWRIISEEIPNSITTTSNLQFKPSFELQLKNRLIP